MKLQLLRNDILHFNQGAVPDLQVLEIVQPSGLVRVLDPAACKDGYQKLDDIRQQISQGQVTVIRAGQLQAKSLYKSSALTEQCTQHALRITREIQEMMQTYQWSACKAYASIKATYKPVLDDPVQFVGRATVYRYLKNERCGLPLLRGNATKGNRSARYAENVTSMVTDLVKNHYLQEKSPWSILHVTAYANTIGRTSGLLSGDSKISRAFVRKIVHVEAHGDPEYSRLDQRTISAAKSIAKHKIRIRSPFARVEQDAVHLPFLVDTPFGLSNNLYLLHAIDCCTSQVVGWQFVIGAPSVSDSRKCLERILFSKKEICEVLGINNKFDLYGSPLLMVFDNGPETKGERMKNLTVLGIDLMHCKARQAQGKPFIERLNRSLKEALEILPGCTRFAGVDGQRDPIKLGDGAIKLEDLKAWVIRWYFEKWAETPLKRFGDTVFTDAEFLGHSPNERWENITVKHGNPIPLPPSLNAWRMASYESTTVKLSRKTGVTFDTYHFKGANLETLIAVHGENQITVLSDPSDFRRVYVPNGEGYELIELINDCIDESTLALSFVDAKARRKENNLSIEPSVVAEKFSRDLYNATTQAKPEGKPKKKPKDISRDTTIRAKENNAIERARSNPLPKLPISQPNQQVEMSKIEVPLMAVRDRKSGVNQP